MYTGMYNNFVLYNLLKCLYLIIMVVFHVYFPHSQATEGVITFLVQ